MCGAVLVMLGGCGGDDPAPSASGWTTVTDEPSGASIDLPAPAEPEADTAHSADGSSVTLRNYTTTVAGGQVEVGFNVLDTHGQRYDFAAGVREVASSLDGRVVSTRELDVDGHDAVDVELAYGGDNVVMFQLVDLDDHVVQPLVAGPAARRDLVKETYEQLTSSLDVAGS